MGNVLADCRRCSIDHCDVCTDVLPQRNGQRSSTTRHASVALGAEAGAAAGQTGGTGSASSTNHAVPRLLQTGSGSAPNNGPLLSDEDHRLAAIAASYDSGGTGGNNLAGNILSEEELLAQAIRREKLHEESLERARLREEQSAEYEESLRIDQQREQEKALRKKEEEEAAVKAAEEEEERLRKEEERAAEEAEAEAARKQQIKAIIQKAQEELVPEPQKGEEGRIEVMVRVPDGRRLKRAFLKSHTVSQLYHFANVEGGEALAERQFRLVSSMPRKVYEDHEATLESEGFKGQSALLVEIIEDDDE